MANKGDKSLITSVLLVCIVVGVGVAAYVKLAPANVVPNEPVTTEEQEGGAGVQLLTPYYVDNELRFKQEQTEVPANVDPKVFAVNRYLRTAKPVPHDAELVSCTVEGSVATLDFNAAFGISYGTDDESTVVNGILATMGQFPDVSYVKFLVEGRELETLGNLDLTGPQDVIRLPSVAQGDAAQGPAKS